MSFHDNSTLELLRQRADVNSESETHLFWMKYLRDTIFVDTEKWVVGAEQHPVPHSTQRRMDIKVSYRLDRSFTVFLVGEAKMGKASHTELATVEKQGLDRCKEALSYERGEAAWVMTCRGSKARMWACRVNSTELEPLYPLEATGAEKKDYKEIKTHEEEFRKIFNLLLPLPKPTSLTVTHLLSVLAGTTEMVDEGACYVIVHENDGQFKRCTVGDEEIYLKRDFWSQGVIVCQGQLRQCWWVDNDGGDQYWTWDRK